MEKEYLMNKELFSQTVDENYTKIFNICYRYFGNRELAADACQETFLKMWLNINKYRGDASLYTWACRIAINVCLTSIRTNRKEKSVIVSEDESEYREKISDENMDDEDKDIKLKFFNEFMNRLQVADRTLVTLYLENMDTHEMASVTGLSESNVRTRIHRIKSQIKKEWEVQNGTR